MFLVKLGYKWNIASEVDGVQGVVFLATGSTSQRLTRATPPEWQRVLFDPQLYLAGLEAASCENTCARLATYPWFDVQGIPGFDSDETGLRQWEQNIRAEIGSRWPGRAPEGQAVALACRSAIEFQLRLGCTHLVIPAPLIAEREDEGQSTAEWLDAGLSVAENLEVGQPLLVTVAVDEGILNEAAFASGGILDTIADQVTARSGLDGVYIVVAQTYPNSPFENSEFVQRAYLHLSQVFSQAGCGIVLTNFACVFGLACVAAGATGYATGSSYSLRRLSLAGFKPTPGAVALPHFYSHPMISELLPETDLDLIAERRLLRRVRDITPFSEALMERLEVGGSASEIPAWAESQNNLGMGSKHFIFRQLREVDTIRPMSLRRKRQYIRDWLEDADANVLYLTQRLKEARMQIKGRIAPAQEWLRYLDATAGG
jgi:hypothetical protein